MKAFFCFEEVTTYLADFLNRILLTYRINKKLAHQEIFQPR